MNMRKRTDGDYVHQIFTLLIQQYATVPFPLIGFLTLNFGLFSSWQFSNNNLLQCFFLSHTHSTPTLEVLLLKFLALYFKILALYLLGFWEFLARFGSFGMLDFGILDRFSIKIYLNDISVGTQTLL